MERRENDWGRLGETKGRIGWGEQGRVWCGSWEEREGLGKIGEARGRMESGGKGKVWCDTENTWFLRMEYKEG